MGGKREKTSCDVLLLFVNDNEQAAVFEAARKHNLHPSIKPSKILSYHDFGEINGLKVFGLQTKMGATGRGATGPSTSEAIKDVNPEYIIAVGIAFGVNEEKQQIGNILVSDKIFCYEPGKIEKDGTRTRRGDEVSVPDRLWGKFKTTSAYWKDAKIIFGPLLSGEKLLDHFDTREQLKNEYPEAIGGEMEAAGIYSASEMNKKDWIIVKAICDFAYHKEDVNKEQNQKTAATNAASFVFYCLTSGAFPAKKKTKNSKTESSGNHNTHANQLTTVLPCLSPDEIIGRHKDLEDLHHRLFNNKKVGLVNGLGGIGKTTLAQAYLGKYLNEYKNVAWVSLVSDNIHQDFINTHGLLESLGIQCKDKTPEQLFLDIMRQLQGFKDQPNLIIIDNGDMLLSRWHDSLPHMSRWHVLVTSREKIEGFDPIDLDFLSKDDAVKLFLSHYTLGKIDEDNIRKIVVAVDLHTLTVEILGKTAQKQRSSFDDLMKAIQNDIRANVDVRHKGEKIERITSYLCSIFTLSKLSEAEINLLKLMSCLPSEFHTFERLAMLIGPSYKSEVVSLSETLENLSDKGWLLKNPTTESYKIHRIIIDVVKREAPIQLSDVEGLLETITKKLSIDQTKDNPIEKFPWIPYGHSMLSVFPSNEDAAITLLQNNLALVLKALGDYAGAKDLLEKAMKSAETNFGPDHPTTAVSYSNLATVLNDLGDYQMALELSEKSVFIFTKCLPEGHPTIMTVCGIRDRLRAQMVSV